MKKIKTTSRYRKYIRGRFVGEFEYELTTEVAPENRTRVRAMTEAMMDAAHRRKLAAEEAFEDLVEKSYWRVANMAGM